MLVVHATKKQADRLGPVPRHQREASTTALGPWYATALFWRPQVSLFVNEATLLPVLVPLAPAAGLLERFPGALAEVLDAHGADAGFVNEEMAESAEWRLAKTANRSVVGIMNEFAYLGAVYTEDSPAPSLIELSLRLSTTPCGPLYKRHGSPDRELAALMVRP